MPRISVLPLEGCPAFRAITADELGYLKVITVRDKGGEPSVVSRWREADRFGSVTCMSLLQDDSHNLLAGGRKDGKIDILDSLSGALVSRFDRPAQPSDSSATPSEISSIVAIHFLNKLDDGRVPLLTCSSSGAMDVRHVSVGSSEEPQSSVATWNVLKASTSSVAAVQVDPSKSFAAVGGKGFELTVWDLSRKTQSWAAKCPKPDKLDLVPPAWGTSLAYASREDSRKVVVGTAEHTWRLYDVAAQRRPVMIVPFGETPIRGMATSTDGFSLYVGNGTGHLAEFDLRTGKLVGGFKGGQCGSIRSMAVHPSLPILASVGLDRYLRVHSLESHKLLGKVYLKQPLMQVLFDCKEEEDREVKAETGEENEVRVAEDDGEELDESPLNGRSILKKTKSVKGSENSSSSKAKRVKKNI